MEDIILIEYLKKKGILNDHDYSELTSEMKHKEHKEHEDYSHSTPESSRSDKYSDFFDSFKEVTRDMNPSEKDKFVDRLKDYDNKPVEHFNESYAKYLVSKMWHKDDMGRKCMGEKYDMLKAKEVCERYRGMISSYVNPSDIYIAINSQYHNYHCLFKKWFGEDLDHKIIESAIRYWFMDESYSSSKLWDHFKDK